MSAPSQPPAAPVYSTVSVHQAKLGDLLGGVSDLTQQIQSLLTDLSPGGLVAKREELTQYITQVQGLVADAEGKLAELTGLTDLLTQFVSVLVGSLGQFGLTKIEFGGPGATVSAEHAAAFTAAAGPGRVYGFTLLAATPDGAAALQAILGAGQTVVTGFTGTRAP